MRGAGRLYEAPPRQFNSHTPAFRYTANMTHKRYGTCSFAARESTFPKERIIHKIMSHSTASQRSANPKRYILKKIMLQKKLNASWARKICRLRERSSDGGAR